MGGLGRATDPSACPVCYPPIMTKPSSRRSRRRVLAVVLAAMGIGLAIVEPFPKGAVLVSFTESHGLDVGDLPAIALLLVAAWLAV
jgi:hypothetical protein